MVWAAKVFLKSIIGWAALIAAVGIFMSILTRSGYAVPHEFGVEFIIGAFAGIGFSMLWRWIN